MDQYFVDLHIHSRFSRAVSKSITPRSLAAWGRVKGLDVLGTGDCTHPAWMAELEAELAPDEATGLYVLKNSAHLETEIPWLGESRFKGRTRFLLQGEISSIYKHLGRVRKIHNLVYFPDFDAAKRFNAKLEKIGNIGSDGRPILGLPARDLLDLVLSTDPRAHLIPAHIWTPWFSLFGSKSGYDSVEECFGDLAKHLFALETGLSSDTAMNRLVSALDRYQMLSFSDAHSGPKLGRQASIFSGEKGYDPIFKSLKGETVGSRFDGVVDFFPEEGKYHLDGHRDCKVMLDPRETKARGGVCPVCGKGLTLGVLHRVMDLADRDEPVFPPGKPGFTTLIPLEEVVAEVIGSSVGSKKTLAYYAALFRDFGPELPLLLRTSTERLAAKSGLLAEAISRMRSGKVYKEPGFDGQFGRIAVFSPKERKELSKGAFLIEVAPGGPEIAVGVGDDVRTSQGDAGEALDRDFLPGAAEVLPPRDPAANGPRELSPEQIEAVLAGPDPVLCAAGPGAGKTHTLLSRIERLIREGENPRRILALTFTRKAAGELRDRLVRRLGENASIPRADTLHALAFEIWSKAYSESPAVLDEEASRRTFDDACAQLEPDAKKRRRFFEKIGLKRETRSPLTEVEQALFHAYTKAKEYWNLADYTDLLEFWLEQLRAGIYVCPYTQLLVDEVQDLSPLQFDLVKALNSPSPKDEAPSRSGVAQVKVEQAGEDSGGGLFLIGDPNQAIYGFRGGVRDVETTLKGLWPKLTTIRLADNHRSAEELVKLASLVFPDAPPMFAHNPDAGAIRFYEAPTAQSEAAFIAERARRLLGGSSHTGLDHAEALRGAGALESLDGTLAPGDVAVLVRFKALMGPIAAGLSRMGLPVSLPEQEAWWGDERVKTLLHLAGAMFGAAPPRGGLFDNPPPEKVVAKGPLGLSVWLAESPPFDRFFWESRTFKDFVKAYDEAGNWLTLLNQVHLLSEADLYSRRSEKIRIMTMHAAKGLEFKAVFVPCLEDGLSPFFGMGFLTGKPFDDLGKNDEDEERRLFYVALTRARQALFLSHAAKRTLFGKEMRLKPSRFLVALLEAAKGKGLSFDRRALREKTRTSAKQLSLL